MDIIRLSAAAMPEALRHAHPPPAGLYFRGKFPETSGVAVVGTRRMSPYGQACIARLVPAIVRAGEAVVSGLAFGVDAEAHQVTLDLGGVTIAVLGSGVDDASIYPRANFSLARRILASGGVVVSEYAPGISPRKENFPARNRIIVGLSKAVLVIEAPARSGAMITARLALEQGVDVWAVPGPIIHPNAEGPNQLIRHGATPITRAEDIYEALGLEAVAAPVTDVPPTEKAALDAMRDGASTADEIARALKLSPSAAAALLTSLEVRGAVRQVGGGRYTLYTSP